MGGNAEILHLLNIEMGVKCADIIEVYFFSLTIIVAQWCSLSGIEAHCGSFSRRRKIVCAQFFQRASLTVIVGGSRW
jgi:hypothetical protein